MLVLSVLLGGLGSIGLGVQGFRGLGFRDMILSSPKH